MLVTSRDAHVMRRDVDRHGGEGATNNLEHLRGWSNRGKKSRSLKEQKKKKEEEEE